MIRAARWSRFGRLRFDKPSRVTTRAMTAGSISYGLLGGLAIALLVAAVTDLRRRQVDHALNAAVALAAPLFWWGTGPGLAVQLGSAAIVLLLLAALFAAGAIGGGDVKLLAALALWLPWRPFLELIVVMALLGGLVTVGGA